MVPFQAVHSRKPVVVPAVPVAVFRLAGISGPALDNHGNLPADIGLNLDHGGHERDNRPAGLFTDVSVLYPQFKFGPMQGSIRGRVQSGVKPIALTLGVRLVNTIRNSTEDLTGPAEGSAETGARALRRPWSAIEVARAVRQRARREDAQLVNAPNDSGSIRTGTLRQQ